MKEIFKWKYVPIFLMLLIGALMIGLTDYLTIEGSAENIGSQEWWTNIITTNVGIISLIAAILMMGIDQFKTNNIVYLDVTKDIYEFRKDPSYSKPIANLFYAEETLKLKKEAHKDFINKKINRLKPKLKDLEIFIKGTEEDQNKNKYCRRMKKYLLLSSDEYIEEHISRIRIKHATITDSLIFSGIPTTSEDSVGITKYKSLAVARDLAPRFLLGFAITFIAASVIPELKDGITSAMLFRTAIKLFTMASQIQFTRNYTETYNNKYTLAEAIYRWGFIDSYKIWFRNKVEQQNIKKGEQVHG